MMPLVPTLRLNRARLLPQSSQDYKVAWLWGLPNFTRPLWLTDALAQALQLARPGSVSQPASCSEFLLRLGFGVMSTRSVTATVVFGKPSCGGGVDRYWWPVGVWMMISPVVPMRRVFQPGRSLTWLYRWETPWPLSAVVGPPLR